MRLVPVFAVSLGVIAMSGCRNACQQLCDEVADYMEECGETVSKDWLKQCRKDQSNTYRSPTAREACADAQGGIAEEWTCEDIGFYFDTPAGDDGGDDTGVTTQDSDAGSRTSMETK